MKKMLCSLTLLILVGVSLHAQIKFAGETYMSNADFFGLTNSTIGYSNSNLVDIDGDGDLDLMSGTGDGSFFYFENTAGAGNTPAFASSQTNPFGLSSITTTYSTSDIVDIDGDGDLDLMSGARDGNFYYFENTAGAGNTPTFAAAQTNPFNLSDIGVNSNSNLIDIDGDGDLDLMSGATNGNFYYFENTAGVGNTPAYAAVQTNPFSLTDIGSRSSSYLVDLDSDGDLDLMSNGLNSFFYFENTAGVGNTPVFAAVQADPFSLSNDFIPWNNVTVKDLDSDGDLDLMVGSAYGDFFYYENTAGVGNTPVYSAVEQNPFGLYYLDNAVPLNNVDVIDIDGDGDLDIMGGAEDGNFFYFENTAGVGVSPVFISPEANPFGLVNIGDFRSSCDIVDIDGDGDLDLMSGSREGRFYYFENTAGVGNTPSFAAPQLQAPVSGINIFYTNGYSNVDLVDVDNDGDIDMISGSGNGELFYFENTAGAGNSPSFNDEMSPFGFYDHPCTTPGCVSSSSESHSNFIDLDGDGDLDLVKIIDANDDLTYFENTAGVGNTPYFGNLSFGDYFGGGYNGDFVDLDGDGDLDLLNVDGLTSVFEYYENTAGVGNTPNFSLSSARKTNPFNIISGDDYSDSDILDIDGDGDLDLMRGSESGNFYYYENTAGAGNTPSYNIYQTNPFGLSDIGDRSNSNIVDIDGDGDLDLMSGATDGNFYYFENTAGAGNTPSFASVQANPFSLSGVGQGSNSNIVDIDGDGDLDLMSGAADGNFYYFENTAGAGNTPVFAAAQTNPFSLSDVGQYSSSDLVDLDEDGDLDLMSGERSGNFYYFNNTAGAGNTPVFDSPLITPYGLSRIDASISGIIEGYSNSNLVDLDGDGDLDLMSGSQNGDFFYFENIAPLPILTWTGATSTAWSTGSNWDDGSGPTTASQIIIPDVSTASGNFPEVSVDALVNNITINSNATIDILTGGSMSIKGVLENNGTYTVASGAALVQGDTSTLSGNGTFIVKRATNASKTFIGSPINNQSVGGFGIAATGPNGAQVVPDFLNPCNPDSVDDSSPVANIMEMRESASPISNCAQSLWHVKSTGNLENGRGYLIYPGATTLQFSGTVNNDTVTYAGLTRQTGTINTQDSSVASRGWHLVSNPYPSPIQLTGADLTAMGFDNQLHRYEPISGTWVSNDPLTSATIAVGQGFQIRKTVVGGTADFQLNNSHRVSGNPTFYKQSNPRDVYLNISLEGNGYADQSMVYFYEGATEDFDPSYDANKLMGDFRNPMLYTEAAEERLSYNAYAPLAFGEQMSVPLSLHAGTDGSFTLNFEAIYSLNDLDITVTLEDLKLDTNIVLSEGYNYTFDAANSEANERFLLHFNKAEEEEVVNNITQIAHDGITLYPNPTDGNITLQLNQGHSYNRVVVYDITGKEKERLVINQQTNSYDIQTASLSNGVYFLRLSGAESNSTLKFIKQ